MREVQKSSNLQYFGERKSLCWCTGPKGDRLKLLCREECWRGWGNELEMGADGQRLEGDWDGGGTAEDAEGAERD